MGRENQEVQTMSRQWIESLRQVSAKDLLNRRWGSSCFERSPILYWPSANKMAVLIIFSPSWSSPDIVQHVSFSVSKDSTCQNSPVDGWGKYLQLIRDSNWIVVYWQHWGNLQGCSIQDKIVLQRPRSVYLFKPLEEWRLLGYQFR